VEQSFQQSFSALTSDICLSPQKVQSKRSQTNPDKPKAYEVGFLGSTPRCSLDIIHIFPEEKTLITLVSLNSCINE